MQKFRSTHIVGIVLFMQAFLVIPSEAGWLDQILCRLNLKPIAAYEKEAREKIEVFAETSATLSQMIRNRSCTEERISRYLAELGDAIYASYLLEKQKGAAGDQATELYRALRSKALSAQDLDVASAIAIENALAGKRRSAKASHWRFFSSRVQLEYSQQLKALDPDPATRDSVPLLKNLVADAQATRLGENDPELKEYLSAVESTEGFNKAYGLIATFQNERSNSFRSHSKIAVAGLNQFGRLGDAVAAWLSEGVEGAFSGAVAALDRDLIFRYWMGEPVVELGEKMDHSDYFILLSEVMTRAPFASTKELISAKEELGRFGKLLEAYARKQTYFTPFHTDQRHAVRQLTGQIDRELRERAAN